ncbi:DnaT-like ssDNA-binding domain-containing protein [Pontibacterium granulatum]|uniref:DnaT-like ssDNA-binding domain-containing protein n=1 Tax=Pontibacterium granulatum TaxID=2036029 RepID=UPI00249BDD05|nr:DnaT-like ssDNA-binding domain-containing protein [Pontibacterium granulatum]MDI3323321.1 DnaT-like ssDNA-binding domain-containing protein [Pontibacterium granulatum]
MGYQIPEQPMLIYPSLAEKFGLEEALLLGIYHQLSQRMGLRLRSGTEIKLDTQSWRQLVPFWSQDQIAMVTNSLVSQGAIDASVSKTLVKIVLLPNQGQPAPEASEPTVVAEPEMEMVSRLQVVDQPPPLIDEPPPLGMAQPPQRPMPPVQEPQRQSPAAQRTPAPAFGGSTGWRRHKSELQVIFEQHEERNQHLHTMFLGWQPTANFFELLPRHGISEEFARSCIDEFVLYWVNRDRRETNWDQKFLAWVKRDWVQKQTRDAREQRVAQQEKSFNNENSRRDTREKRKRVTQAIMDIKDTDW